MESILDAIGNTPLVRVRRCAPSNGAELWVKLEYRNPDRVDEGPDCARDDRGASNVQTASEPLSQDVKP